MDSPVLMGISDMIQLVMMKIKMLEMQVCFMVSSSPTLLSRQLKNTHFIVYRNKENKKHTETLF
jgi:hypothetical protein